MDKAEKIFEKLAKISDYWHATRQLGANFRDLGRATGRIGKGLVIPGIGLGLIGGGATGGYYHHKRKSAKNDFIGPMDVEEDYEGYGGGLSGGAGASGKY